MITYELMLFWNFWVSFLILSRRIPSKLIGQYGIWRHSTSQWRSSGAMLATVQTVWWISELPWPFGTLCWTRHRPCSHQTPTSGTARQMSNVTSCNALLSRRSSLLPNWNLKMLWFIEEGRKGSKILCFEVRKTKMFDEMNKNITSFHEA